MKFQFKRLISQFFFFLFANVGVKIGEWYYGKTGFVMDFLETDKVAEKIDWILSNPKEARKIGKNASYLVGRDFSLEKSASGFCDAVSKACQCV